MAPLVPVETASRGNDLHNRNGAGGRGSGEGSRATPQPLLSQTGTGAASPRYDVRYVAPLVAQILGQAIGSNRPSVSSVRDAYGQQSRPSSGARLDCRV